MKHCYNFKNKYQQQSNNFSKKNMRWQVVFLKKMYELVKLTRGLKLGNTLNGTLIVIIFNLGRSKCFIGSKKTAFVWKKLVQKIEDTEMHSILFNF